MSMHEHVTCKNKFIMGLAQSKPTSTQHSNKVNIHLKCMKHCYNAHVMQCMKFKIILTKTHPKIITRTQKFEKSQPISKIPKVRSKIMKMHDKGEESIIPDEEHKS